ncbi:site-specific integrase [Shewanella sp. SM20]|uniref:tyrosine-type recombinase/integrase n=1 Tax=Shewanella sp. SM20 TaxID=2912792 RepID=UPI0021DA3A49|nr:site-specific integrase [Shewanella sp. SM20]MCU8094336.1 site-specific integrase [Shewanella sp. SM20]
MGSINSRNNKLYLDFRFKGIRCREMTMLEDTTANRKRARAVLTRIEAEIQLNQFEYARHFPNSKQVEKFEAYDRMTALRDASRTVQVSIFVEQWLLEKKVEWRPSQLRTIEDILTLYVLPRFGEREINSITKTDILSFRADLVDGQAFAKELSASRINQILSPLRVILNDAAERYEFVNPWKSIKPLPVNRKPVHPFTLDEVLKFIDFVRPDFRCYFLVRFFTGLRTGEIDGLQWENVDFERRQILVRQSWVRNKLGPVKTKTSLREIDMNDLVYDALFKHSKLSDRSGFVFQTSCGKPMNNKNMSYRVWYPTLDILRISRRNPYQTRHTAATLWLASGESPEWIAKQMGHANTNMLFTVYSRYVPNLTRKDGSAFEAFLNQKLRG